MRFAMVFSLVMLALGHESASAQSGVAVVRFGKHTNVDAPCTQPTMGTDPACVATVLEVQDTKSLILQAKNDAKSEATAECTNQITAAKTDLTRDLNAIPSKAMEALRAEIKEELKSEILQELIDEINAGKVRLPLQGRSPTKPTAEH